MSPRRSVGTPQRRCGVPLWLLLSCALLAQWGSGPLLAQQAQPTRVGYVDMKRLIDNSPQVRRARERLQSEFDAALALLREDERRLSALEQRFATAETGGNAESADALRGEIAPLKRSVERTRQRLSSELEQRSEQETERAWPLINDAVAEFARSNGYDLVISSGALYVSGRVDITDRVLELLDQQSRREATQ